MYTFLLNWKKLWKNVETSKSASFSVHIKFIYLIDIKLKLDKMTPMATSKTWMGILNMIDI